MLRACALIPLRLIRGISVQRRMTDVGLALLGGAVGAAAGVWLRQRRYLPVREPALSWGSVVVATIAAAGVFGVLGWRTEGTALLLGIWFATGGVIATWTDLDGHRLPDWLTWPLAAVILTIIVADATATGSWTALVTAALAAGAVGVLLLLWAVFGSLGGGDVKLGLSVGLILGFLGWPYVILGLLISFVAGGVWAVVLLVKGRAKTAHLPFGPALVLGVISCLVLWPGSILG